MLTGCPVHTTLPAADLSRARQFDTDTLGPVPEGETPGGIFFGSGDSRFLVFPTGGSPSGAHTQMGFTVDDVEAEVVELKSKRAEFGVYDFPGFDPATSLDDRTGEGGPVQRQRGKSTRSGPVSLSDLVISELATLSRTGAGGHLLRAGAGFVLYRWR